MGKLTHAVILCGGYGTRFLPMTKVLPKELFPLVDRPALDYLIKEAVDSGITNITIVINKRKTLIKDYFEQDLDYENFVKGKPQFLKLLDTKPKGVKINFVEQTQQLGSGDAVKCAKQYVKNNDFCLMYGDDLVIAKTPLLKQMIQVYDKYGKSVNAVFKCSRKEITKYGVVDQIKKEGRVVHSTKICEKPKSAKVAPSRFASVGRYIITKDVWKQLDKIEPAPNGEYQLTDALNNLNGFMAYQYEGKRFDLGYKPDLVRANVYLSKHKQF